MKLAQISRFLVLFLALPTLAAAEEFIAHNATSDLLHDVNDYFEWIPDELLPASERAALLESGVASAEIASGLLHAKHRINHRRHHHHAE